MTPLDHATQYICAATIVSMTLVVAALIPRML